MSDAESTDSLDYLQDGFDANTLTVPKLRSLLVKHQVDYPSTAKKSQLVELFENGVVPQRAKYLRGLAKAKRSSKGITNADRGGTSSTVDLEEDFLPPPSTTKTPRSTRRSTRTPRPEESDEETPALRRATRSVSPVKKTPRAPKQSLPPIDDAEVTETVKRTARKSRKSDDLPVIKNEPTDDELPQPGPERQSSVFTDDNPFQRSSPSARVSSVDHRRRTVNETPSNKRKSTSKPRRVTEVTPQASAGRDSHPPTRRTFELPISALNGLPKAVDDLEPTEEFTPEEQMELIRERSANGQDAIVRRPRRAAGGGTVLKKSAVAVLATMLATYGGWYCQEKAAVGFCNIGREAKPLVNVNTNNLPPFALELIEPQCIPCPAHAYCHPNFEVTCEKDYKIQPHPLSLGGLLPFPPTCEPNQERARRMMMVTNQGIEVLRDRRAKFECGDLKDDKGKPAKSVELTADKLKDEVSKKRKRGMSDQEFADLWPAALGEIEKREEVEVNGHESKGHNRLRGAADSTSGQDPAHGHDLLSSTSLARLPLKCAIRRHFRLTLARYRVELGSLIFFFLSGLYGYWQFTELRRIDAAVPQLADLAYEKLKRQAARHRNDEVGFPETFISLGGLRDDVLKSEHNPKKRDKIWKKVQQVVERNANVMTLARPDRFGQVSRTWQWTGDIGAIEDVPAPTDRSVKKRHTPRVSWGEYEQDGNKSPVSGMDGGPRVGGELNKWQETPRPRF